MTTPRTRRSSWTFWIVAIGGPIAFLATNLVLFSWSRNNTLRTLSAQPARLAQVAPQFNLRRDHDFVRVQALNLAQGTGHMACLADTQVPIYVRVEHTSPAFAISSLKHRPDDPPVNLAYRKHITGQPRGPHDQESIRTHLAAGLWPGHLSPQHIYSRLLVRCPPATVSHDIEIQLVQESVAWQSEVSPPSRYVTLTLRGSTPNENTTKGHHSPVTQAAQISEAILSGSTFVLVAEGLSPIRALFPDPSRSQIVGSTMAMVQNYWNSYNKVLSPDEQSWIDLFLLAQREDGALPSWVHHDGATLHSGGYDENSEAELWILKAAADSVFAHTLPDGWLTDSLGGTPRRQRLLTALESFVGRRWVPSRQCILDTAFPPRTGFSLRPDDPWRHMRPPTCGLFVSALFRGTVKQWSSLVSEELFNAAVGYAKPMRSGGTGMLDQSAHNLFYNEGTGLLHDSHDVAESAPPPTHEVSLAGNVAANLWQLGLRSSAHQLAQSIRPSTSPKAAWAQLDLASDEVLAHTAAFLIDREDAQVGTEILHYLARRMTLQGTVWEGIAPDRTRLGSEHFVPGAASFLVAVQAARKRGIRL